MKPSTCFLWVSFLTLAISSPLRPRETNITKPFTVLAFRSASPIHLLPFAANGEHFWLGKDTQAYCPLQNTTLCPPGNTTVLEEFENGVAMYSDAPGGQTVYVNSTGALSFTEAHVPYIPPGGDHTNFTLTSGPSISSFGFHGLGATGFLACPSPGNVGPYQVFADVAALTDADVPGGCAEECIGFDTWAIEWIGGPAAWQYV